MKRNLFLLSTAVLALLSTSKHVHGPKHDHHLVNEINAAGTCQTNSDSVTTLPGWNAQQTFPCSYAGTFEVSRSPDKDHNLVYWLFKNTTLDTTYSPLIIYIQGQSGLTST